MSKLKTKSGAKKRFKLTGTGKIKRKNAYKRRKGKKDPFNARREDEQDRLQKRERRGEAQSQGKGQGSPERNREARRRRVENGRRNDRQRLQIREHRRFLAAMRNRNRNGEIRVQRRTLFRKDAGSSSRVLGKEDIDRRRSRQLIKS